MIKPVHHSTTGRLLAAHSTRSTVSHAANFVTVRRGVLTIFIIFILSTSGRQCNQSEQVDIGIT